MAISRLGFSVETLQPRRQWYDRVKVLKEKKHLQPRIFYLIKLSFRIEGRELSRQAKTEGIHH